MEIREFWQFREITKKTFSFFPQPYIDRGLKGMEQETECGTQVPNMQKTWNSK
jgi:hypothetical protein